MIDKQPISLIVSMQQQQKTPRYIVHICRNCGVSTSFRWNFQISEPTKTCYECGFIDLVEQNKQQEVA